MSTLFYSFTKNLILILARTIHSLEDLTNPRFEVRQSRH